MNIIQTWGRNSDDTRANASSSPSVEVSSKPWEATGIIQTRAKKHTGRPATSQAEVRLGSQARQYHASAVNPTMPIQAVRDAVNATPNNTNTVAKIARSP
jgi:hypothetical protein